MDEHRRPRPGLHPSLVGGLDPVVPRGGSPWGGRGQHHLGFHIQCVQAIADTQDGGLHTSVHRAVTYHHCRPEVY